LIVSLSINIAVEDDLSECILRKLAYHTRRGYSIKVRYPLGTLPGGSENPQNAAQKRGLSGYGQIRVNLSSFNKAAEAGTPFVVLTDLDIHVKCPGALLARWLKHQTPSSNLLFRVAVKEVEAWILADRTNLAVYLNINPQAIPAAPETIPDPKVEIVNLARTSLSSEIINDLVPAAGSTAEVGRYYERSLINFVRDYWDIDEAAKNAASLSKAVRALRMFAPKS
jgi:hypothetical protein